MISTGYGGLGAVLKGVAAGLFLTCVSAIPALSQTTTILALGDSLTAGYGLEQGDGFVPQLEDWLTAQGLDVRVQNGGVSGDTSAGGAARLAWSLTEEVDMVLVTLGGNDMLRGISPEETYRNLEKILTELTQRELEVVLIGIPGPGNFGADYRTRFNAIFPRLADAYEVQLYPNFLAPLTEAGSMAAARQLFLQDDGLHPNKAGVLKIVEGLGPVIMARIQ
ncbi:arylesterase [Aliiroseovarius marinus]|uniref:arylesterase n=1 Tax=Aliiroseovarius marinus TaxID=2500159 RepID=UPI003D7E4C06